MAPLIATYLGAEVIEFHLIKDRTISKKLFDKKIGGFDWRFQRTLEILDMIKK